jgi:glycosyltransferase involved in cell wall biosynthesis
MGIPRVSIMMNVHDGAAYVRDALDSVLAQTFVDWEIVFWDNGSTDRTPEIAAGFGDPRLRYFRSPEGTPPALARQLAIGQARGEWLAFLDHDDVWLHDKLARQLELAGDDRVAIVYGRAVSIGADGVEVDFDHRREFGPLLQGDIFQHLYADSCFIQMSSVMLRRSAIAKVGGIANWIEIISDYYLYLELTRHSQVRAVQGVVSRYRLRATSLTHTAEWRMHVEAMRLVEHWAGSVDPQRASIRCRLQSTRLAVAEMRRPGLRMAGMARLVRDGSIWFLVSRPPVWVYREFRRLVRRPIWKQNRIEPVWRGAPASIADSPVTLSVILINRGGRDMLRECLLSLHAQMRLAPGAWEVIVAGGSPQDGSAEMVRAEFPQVPLVADPEDVGLARATNRAYRSCRGRYVLLLDSGTVVLDHAADRMLEVMVAHPDVAALGCKVLASNGTFQPSSGNSPRLPNVACHFLLLYRLLPEAIRPAPLFLEREPSGDVEVGWVSGTCMLLRREALGATLFDERFAGSGEDFELCDRLRLGEWNVMYTAAARIIRQDAGSSPHMPDALPSRMRSLRTAYGMHVSSTVLPAYDFVVLAGFFLRTVVYGLAALLRPGRGYSVRAQDSRRCVEESFAALFGRRAYAAPAGER